jgi:hypothetical protein
MCIVGETLRVLRLPLSRGLIYLFRTQGVPRPSASVGPLAVRSAPRQRVCAVLFDAMFASSHWFFPRKTVVRGAGGVSAPAASRLYAIPMQGAR